MIVALDTKCILAGAALVSKIMFPEKSPATIFCRHVVMTC